MTNLSKAPARLHRALDAEYTHEDLYKAEAKAERIQRSSVGNGDPDDRAAIQRRLNAALEDVQIIKRALGRANDSSRKAPARLHRALDAVLDARPVRDAEYVPTDKTIYWPYLVSPDYPAHKNSPAGERAWAAKQKAYPGLTGEALWAKPMPRDYPKYGSSLGRGKDRIPADCLDLGTLALDGAYEQAASNWETKLLPQIKGVIEKTSKSLAGKYYDARIERKYTGLLIDAEKAIAGIRAAQTEKQFSMYADNLRYIDRVMKA